MASPLSFFRFQRNNPGEVAAWSFYDFANSAFATVILAVIYNKYYAGVVAGGAGGILFGSIRIPGATMLSLMVAATMILIAVSSPLLGALADILGRKKRFLGAYAFIGCVATALMITVDAGEWLWGGLLFIFAQLGFAGANIFYNALLVDIAEPEDYGKVSGIGWAWGYIGGGLLLLLNLLMLQSPEVFGLPAGTFTLGHCFVSVAIWWALFSIPLFVGVRETRLAVISKTDNLIRQSWRTLSGTLRKVKQLPELGKFFIAFLIYNDGIETVIIMAAVFGDQELRMGTEELIVFFLMIQAVAFVGSLFFGWLVNRIGNRYVILSCLAVWCIVLIWAWGLGWLGNAHKEYWALGALSALVLGGTQAASRSLQAYLIPPKHASEFFSFFGISGKFAGAIGPLVYGLAVFLAGSLRIAMLTLLLLFVVGALIMWRVNENIGREQAKAFETGG
ncbi:MFS transporter [bacterium]|nr:MFS transporter [bacterium]MBU1937007.1 MFS transporter [bacterium]